MDNLNQVMMKMTVTLIELRLRRKMGRMGVMGILS
jgi:hypothetical protein